MEGGEEEAGVSHQRGALAQLQVGICQVEPGFPGRPFRGLGEAPEGLHLVTGEELQRCLYHGQVPKRQLVRVDWDKEETRRLLFPEVPAQEPHFWELREVASKGRT